MFFIPSTMKSGKNINLQNQSQVENEGGCMRPYEFTHATFLSLLGKKVRFETLALSRAFEPKEPNLNKSSVSGFRIILSTFYHVKILTNMHKFYITICKMTSLSAKGYRTCENDFWDREFAQIRPIPVVLFVLEFVHQIESSMSTKDRDNC